MDHLEESKARPQVNNPASELYADTWDKMPMCVESLAAAEALSCRCCQAEYQRST